MRFLLDENIHAKLGKYLESHGHDIAKVAKSLNDLEVAELSKSEQRIILTHDSDFTNTDLHPLNSHYGVIVIKINSLYLDKVKSALNNLFAKIPPDQIQGGLFLLFEDEFFNLAYEEKQQ
jgi:predicted nuclease of predicted toxin-antitoxin system